MALIIIDMQVDFFTPHPRLQEYQPALIANINALAGFARSQGMPVIWVYTAYQPDMSDANRYLKTHNITTLVDGTPGSALLNGLDVHPDDHKLPKKRYSAFFGTHLAKTLHEMTVETLWIAGINSHACVRTTAIDAYQHDFEVVFALDCINSYDGEHHDVSLGYMDGKIGTMLTNADLFARFGK